MRLESKYSLIGNGTKGYTAGLLHDLMKEVPIKTQRDFLGPNFDDIPDPALHGYCAAK
jgi:HD superfamily phosphohydrolase YqeK